MVNMVGGNWPPQPREMKHDFKRKPYFYQRYPNYFMKEIGHDIYRPQQPNGFSDIESDWVSPELLIRRLSAPKEIERRRITLKNFNEMIEKNFDNAEYMKNLVINLSTNLKKMQTIFPSYRMLKA